MLHVSRLSSGIETINNPQVYTEIYEKVYGLLIARINDLEMLSRFYVVDFTSKRVKEALRFDYIMRMVMIVAFFIEVVLTAIDLIFTNKMTEKIEQTTKNSDVKSDLAFIDLDFA